MKRNMRFYFHISLTVILLACCFEKSLSGQGNSPHQLPYQVVYSDGRTIEGAQIQRDHFFAHGQSNTRLDDQLVFQPNKNVRLIRNRQKRILREGPYIEFVNGDILPGQVESVGVANSGRNMPDYLQVRLSAPLKNHGGPNDSLINVRAEHVARLVTRMPENGSAKSGYIWFKSGKSIVARSIRWRPDEVQVLTNEGLQAIPIHDVAQLHRPIKERIRWMLAGKTEIGLDSLGHQVMFRTVNGAWLTTWEAKMVRHSSPGTVIQPSWALDSIMLAPEDIVEVLFLRPNEISLAALPAETLVKKNHFEKWKWARNRNARGGRLDSGDRDSPIGVGMHAYTAVAFYLPPDAQSFSSWLGLDRRVGDGGCVRASVHVNDLKGEPVWQSDFLQGGDPSVRVGPLSVNDQKRLVLVADFGHQGRPRGADPFDIRDEVDWIDSIIETRPTDTVLPELEEIFPFLRGWTLSEKDRERLSPTQIWIPDEGRWVHALKCPALPAAENADQKREPLLGKAGVHYEYYGDYRGVKLPDFDGLRPIRHGIHPTITDKIPNLKGLGAVLRFRTTLVVPRDGFYEFYLKSDDGSRLYVNGKLLIDNDGKHPPTEKQGRVALRKGGAPIEVEYFDTGGMRHLSLDWMGPGFARQTIQPESFDLARILPWGSANGIAEYTALEPITLSRSVQVTSPNAWLYMAAGRGNDGIGEYDLEVRLDGKPIPERNGRDLHTLHLPPTQSTGGVWHLGDHAGQTVHLQVVIKPLGYPGCSIPPLYVDQLETGPRPKQLVNRPIAKDVLGRWRLRGAESIIKKDYHTGLLSGGDGILRLAGDGTVSVWLRLPSGTQKTGVGYVQREADEMIFDYVNGNWVKDRAEPSADRKRLVVREKSNPDSWRLVFTREELTSFDEYVGLWKLQAGASTVDNKIHSGAFTRGEGRLSIGRDGAFTFWLQYPPNRYRQIRSESSTGQIVLEGGKPIFKYDNETWTDDRGAWAADRKKLTLREIEGNEGKWTMVFLKQ
ncbi:MAG: PA14 domain-containing protein [Planctomycetota bacterium]|nr:PA14 domain-containing protein [Planctomycetota bacterium]